MNGQIVNILGFVGHVVSVTTMYIVGVITKNSYYISMTIPDSQAIPCQPLARMTRKEGGSSRQEEQHELELVLTQ